MYDRMMKIYRVNIEGRPTAYVGSLKEAQQLTDKYQHLGWIVCELPPLPKTKPAVLKWLAKHFQ
jgi:hypothetical protein